MDEDVEAAIMHAGAKIEQLQQQHREWLAANSPGGWIDALRKDAERYRWLRNNPAWLGWEHDFRPDEVERAIDAAMAGKPAVG